MSIQTNIQEVRQRIAAACGECGRDPKEITLVGASKMNDAAACREAIAGGLTALGENRVQELLEKDSLYAQMWRSHIAVRDTTEGGAV